MRSSLPKVLCVVLLSGCVSSGSSPRNSSFSRPGEAPPGACESPEADHPEGIRLVSRNNPQPMPPRGTGFKWGYACVLATIDFDGAVKEVKLLNHIYRPFADELVRVVRTWTYDPVLVDGAPTEVKTVITATFEKGL